MLALLLDQDFPGAEALREQARDVRATPGCDCGCGTLDLHPAGGPAAEVADLVPVEGTVLAPDGEEVGQVLLIVREGRLSTLELAGFAGLPDEGLAVPPATRVRLGP